MRHVISEVTDVPPPQPLLDRRKTPDRRRVWRGGRRDSDWINRPPDALAKLAVRKAKASVVRKIFSVLHLW